MMITDAELAVTAARAGAAVVRGMYGASLTRFEKSAGDFATAADIEAEKAIIDVVRTARPDDAVTGEESGRTGSGAAARMWLVDPLCGTSNYAVRNMLVVVNVALRVGSEVAVHPPFPNEPGFRAVRLLGDPGFAERFRPRVVSTTLAVAWVAAGRRAAYVTDGRLLHDSVHFAAGIALCRAAGCVVTGLDGRPPHTGAGGLVVAADRETHAALLDLIGEQLTLR
ncbi:inositol monophosphatase family protein [Nonomuraea sp. SYSU D8015]|uniref:inositol monophosphatase family protein n=1 Tax=Nonomuraea sp. SYSU D8015 TaxID=2593644 RepID=UPI001660DD63|nr:inositol monophosphatase family protein [Nonomuraea sp. SYSU D8015]